MRKSCRIAWNSYIYASTLIYFVIVLANWRCYESLQSFWRSLIDRKVRVVWRKVPTLGELLNAALDVNLAALRRISAIASNALTVVIYSKRTLCESLEVGADRKSPTSAAVHGNPAIVCIRISSSVYSKVKKNVSPYRNFRDGECKGYTDENSRNFSRASHHR